MSRSLVSRMPMKSEQVMHQHNLRQTFMIFTEGQTEEGYFKKFKVRCKTVTGGNALRIVEEAIIQKKNVKKSFDQFWVVFDKDDATKTIFLKAIQLANKNGLKVAFSCEAFEIWWLFHFMKIASPILRNDYEKKLQRFLPDYTYSAKGLNQGGQMWLILNKQRKTGIENAKLAHKKHVLPENAYSQSVTTVYQLVELLIANSNN